MHEDAPADARDMFAVHTVFRREFGLMPALVRGVADGDRPRVALVADHVALLTLALSAHHAAEDRYIWPLLLERGGREVARIVGVMEEQHDAVHRAVVRVEVAAAAWQDAGTGREREDLAVAVERLIADDGEHLALEEVRAVPLIERYITASEYAKLAPKATALLPPDMLPVIIGMLMYEAAPDVADTVVASMPPEIRPLIRQLAQKAYAVYALELYGTATPPRLTR